MLAVCLLAAALSAPWDPAGVSLSDGPAFGVPPEIVRANYYLALRHQSARQDEVRAWNSAAVADRWWAECRWRLEVWDRLDDAVNCPGYTVPHKLRSLARLRELIGDEAYLSGLLPAPIPSYRE